MFEKEAEEYLKKDGTKAEQILSLMQGEIKVKIKQLPFILAAFQQTYIDGAEFGYNKANEWHYVKDGDLPKEDNRIMLCYCRKGYHGNVGIYVYRLFTKHEFMENKVIAWKEIVLPKLPKESE